MASHEASPARRPPGIRLSGTSLRLLGFAGCGVAAVWCGFMAFGSQAAGRLIIDWGYHAMAVLLALWLWSLVRAGVVPRLRAACMRRTTWLHVLAALGLTSVAVLTVPYHYKVLFDELVLQSTAINMARDHLAEAMGRAYELDGRLQLVQGYLDKRPLLHPFIVSLLHSLTGVREANAFGLNTLLMPVVLLLTAMLGRRLAGPAAGWTALVSLGGFSLLAINATGAGMEMLNLALFLGLALAGVWYLQRPDADRLTVLVLTAVLLANTRYESSVYVFCAALIVLEGWRRAGRVLLPWAVVLSPLLLVPYALHNVYLSGTPVLWELRAGQDVRFSPAYFSANLAYAKTYFFNLGPEIANSPWLTWAGGASLLGWMIWRLRRRMPTVTAAEWAVTAVAFGVVVNLGLLLAYYWGDLSDPIVSRLSLPLHALAALAVGGAVSWLAARGWSWLPRAAPAAALVAYAAWGLPANARIPALNLIESAQRWEDDVIAAMPRQSRLIITEKSPLFWFVRNTSALPTLRVADRLEALAYHWRLRTFDEILVMQRLGPATAEGGLGIEPDSAVPPEIVLEPLAERRVGGKIQRISRVRAIHMEPDLGLP